MVMRLFLMSVRRDYREMRLLRVACGSAVDHDSAVSPVVQNGLSA